jgi:hypothetical protein
MENRKYNSPVAGKEFNFGLLEFYRLKKLHPDFYDYIPRSSRNFNEFDFYSSGAYTQQSLDNSSIKRNYLKNSSKRILQKYSVSNLSPTTKSIKIK